METHIATAATDFLSSLFCSCHEIYVGNFFLDVASIISLPSRQQNKSDKIPVSLTCRSLYRCHLSSGVFLVILLASVPTISLFLIFPLSSIGLTVHFLCVTCLFHLLCSGSFLDLESKCFIARVFLFSLSSRIST